MPRKKGTKSKSYSVEYKLEVLNYLKVNGPTETQRKYEINNSVFYRWERIFLEEGKEGLAKERRGRTSKTDNPNKGRPLNLGAKVEEDLIAENQRLRMENEYLKKLAALIQEEEKKQKK